MATVIGGVEARCERLVDIFTALLGVGVVLLEAFEHTTQVRQGVVLLMDKVVEVHFCDTGAAKDTLGPLSVDGHLVIEDPGDLSDGSGAVPRTGGHLRTARQKKGEREYPDEFHGNLQIRP